MPLQNSRGDRLYVGASILTCQDSDFLVEEAANLGFDFLEIPLVKSRKMQKSKEYLSENEILENAETLTLDPIASRSKHLWGSCVLGRISDFADFFPGKSAKSQAKFECYAKKIREEVGWGVHLGLYGLVLPPPPRPHEAEYVSLLSEILDGNPEMQLWIRIPALLEESRGDSDSSSEMSCVELGKVEEAGLSSSPLPPAPSASASLDMGEGRKDGGWELWDWVRGLLDSPQNLGVLLQISSDLPDPPSALQRWVAEPVRAVALTEEVWISESHAAGGVDLTPSHKRWVSTFFEHECHFFMEMKAPSDTPLVALKNLVSVHGQTPLPPHEQFMKPYRNFLQAPLQPLQDNLENAVYQTFEKDLIKYDLYRQAVSLCLKERHKIYERLEKVSIFVVGAGRGPLMDAVLKACEEVGLGRSRRRLVAVDKNPNAVKVMAMRKLKEEPWKEVQIVSGDMRVCSSSLFGSADILVSELLGSFGDNEASPECLEGAEKSFLKEGGVAIPQNYWSSIRPVSCPQLWGAIRKTGGGGKEEEKLQTPHVVLPHACYFPGDEVKQVFSFEHPLQQDSLQRFTEVSFSLALPCTLHGLVGYFHCDLYGPVSMSIHPSTRTEEMVSWFPILFPLSSPLQLRGGEGELTLRMWRKSCKEKKKVRFFFF